MSDQPDTPNTNIHPFQPKAARDKARDMLGRLQPAAGASHVAATVPAPQKMGLYPLQDDVLVSKPLYNLILLVLTRGSDVDRQKVAEMMQESYNAPFQD